MERSFQRCLYMHLWHSLFRVMGWLWNGTRSVSQTSSVVAPQEGHIQIIFAIVGLTLPSLQDSPKRIHHPRYRWSACQSSSPRTHLCVIYNGSLWQSPYQQDPSIKRWVLSRRCLPCAESRRFLSCPADFCNE